MQLRIAEETKRCEEIDEEISKIQTTIDCKKDEVKEVSSGLVQNMKYKQYLQKVIEAAQELSEDFEDIQDIIDRYKTLKATNDHLAYQMELNMKEHDARRVSYAHFMKKSRNELMSMNNHIAKLQKELESVMVTSNELGNINYGSYDHSNEVIINISQALLVIDNMIERLECHAHPSLSKSTKPSRISALPGLDEQVNMATERLDVIAELINDYDGIATAKCKLTNNSGVQ